MEDDKVSERSRLREANQRLDAEAARMREALQVIGTAKGRYICTPTEVIEPADYANRALADTHAGSLGLAVVEALRQAAKLRARWDAHGAFYKPSDVDPVLADIRAALQAWDNGPPNTETDRESGTIKPVTGGETPGGANK